MPMVWYKISQRSNRYKDGWNIRLSYEKQWHFELFCPQESCFFNQQGKLPIQIIDEELYACPPTLLFGTVDKFAMLPWKKEIGAFFAAGSDNRTPDLVIQDELHLISGPLGTMVGLYETAIVHYAPIMEFAPKLSLLSNNPQS